MSPILALGLCLPPTTGISAALHSWVWLVPALMLVSACEALGQNMSWLLSCSSVSCSPLVQISLYRTSPVPSAERGKPGFMFAA